MSFAGQVLHVFRKDVRRFWWALVAIGVVMALEVTVGLSSSSAFRIRFPLPFGLLSLALAALTAAVVQEDRVADDRAFWATRPVEVGALLMAKLLFLGVFLWALPVLVQTLWFERMGMEGERLGVIADGLVHHGRLIVLAAVLASVTRGLEGFLALGLATWVAVAVLRPMTAPDVASFDEGRRLTQAYLTWWAGLTLGGALLAHQYVTRRTVRTIALGAVALAVTVPVLQRLSLDLSTDALEPARRIAYPRADEIEIERVQLSRETGRTPSGVPVRIRAELVPAPGPPAALRVTDVRSRITGGGIDREWRFDPRLEPFSFMSSGFWPMAEVPSGLQAPGGGRPTRPSRFWAYVAEGPPREMGDIDGRATQLEMTLSADVFEGFTVGRLALSPGATLEAPEMSFVVERVRRTPRGVDVDVRVRRLSRALSAAGSDFERLTAFVLHNPTREGYLVNSSGSSVGGARHTLVGGAAVVDEVPRLDFSEELARLAEGERLSEEWFDAAEIVVVGRSYAGSFEQTLTWAVEAWPRAGGTVHLGPPGARVTR